MDYYSMLHLMVTTIKNKNIDAFKASEMIHVFFGEKSLTEIVDDLMEIS